MWTSNISRLVIRAAALSSLALTTACLDLPIQGEVSGQSMEWVTTSVTLEEPIVTAAGGADQTAALAASSQVVLSDFRSPCDKLEQLAKPGDGSHTLALTLVPSEGDTVVEGVYRIGGAAKGEQGQVIASFLSGMADRIDQEDAVSGVLVVIDANGPSLQGDMHLVFPGGKLSGYFLSSTCVDADAPVAAE